jgi:hypothetical protein
MGTALVYSTFIGGNEDDGGDGISLDSSGNVYVTGYTWSGNFPTTTGAFQKVLRGTEDAFVLKLARIIHERSRKVDGECCGLVMKARQREIWPARSRTSPG